MLDKVNSQLNVLTCFWKAVFVVEERDPYILDAGTARGNITEMWRGGFWDQNWVRILLTLRGT